MEIITNKLDSNDKICRNCGVQGNSMQKNRRVCTICRSKQNRIRIKLTDYNYYDLNKAKLLHQQKLYYENKKKENKNSLVI
jgi:hypothetical protein